MEYQIDFSMQDVGFRAELEYGTLEIAGEGVTQGFRPFQLMTASIAGCSGGVLRKILEKQRFAVHDIRIRAQVSREDGDVKPIKKIHLHFIITGHNLQLEKLDRAVELGYKYCSMVQSVKDCIEVTESFEIVPA
jgi:uncharacterized OsmC-like protein